MDTWIDDVDMEGGLNLVLNPSFELLEDGRLIGWSVPEGMCRPDEGERRTGRRSLRFENKDPTNYKLVVQPLKLIPGRRYASVAWVKTLDVQGEGAGICVEWKDEEGNWLGGVYPKCLSGTSEKWKPVGTIFKLPVEVNGKRVASAQLVLYMRRGTTGVVWFDDVQVREMIEPNLKAMLIDPPYRGIIKAGEPQDIELELEVGSKGSLEIRLDREVIGSAEVERGTERLKLHLPALKEGGHRLTLILLDKEGEQIGYDSIPLHARSAEWFERTTYIDGRGRLIVEGKPFFPIGVYLGPTEEEHLRRLADAGFNAILCYGYGSGSDPLGYMDRAHRFGLKVIYSVKDFFDEKGDELVERYVRMLKGHPALLAWYTNDELGLEWIPKLKERYDLVRSLDPNHPTYQALCRPAEFEEYFETLDVIGPDPYPIPRHPVSMVAEWIDKAREAMRGIKPIWAILQVFSWRVYSGRREDRDPTYEEERCMTYLALIHGAKGVLYYSYYDLFTIDRKAGLKASEELFRSRFGNLRRLAGELNRITPLILFGEPVELEFESSGDLHLKAMRYNGSLFVMAANAGESRSELRIKLPDGFTGREVRDLEGKTRGEVENGVFSDSLEPLECVTYSLR